MSYTISSIILTPSCKQTAYPKKCSNWPFIFFGNPKFKQYSTLFKSCNFQNSVAIPVATVAICVAIKLQLIAIPIKYSCDKNMCVKDLE